MGCSAEGTVDSGGDVSDAVNDEDGTGTTGGCVASEYWASRDGRSCLAGDARPEASGVKSLSGAAFTRSLSSSEDKDMGSPELLSLLM